MIPPTLASTFVLLTLLGHAAQAAFDPRRSNMAQRAQHERRRRADLAQAQSVARTTTNTTTKRRYLSDKTAPFAVEALPDIDYDVGELYSGQLAVGDGSDKSMFFVFQPTVGEPVDEVVIWFNGGPGCSSLEAFLQENGRFIWGWGMYNAVENPYSWVNLSNILWVEYPVGVGFSTGTVTARSEEETAEDFLGFFAHFESVFGIANYSIYVTGESYAGRYVPYVADAMIRRDDRVRFDVSGALLYDPVIGKFDYVGQAVPTVPFVRRNANLLNLNDSFVAALALSHEACGYANYTAYFLRFPPLAPQPALAGPYRDLSAPGVDCDVWSLVYAAAPAVNPCANVYEVSTTCPILSDPLAYPGNLQYGYGGLGASGPYFDRADVKRAMHAPAAVAWAECSGPVFADEGGQYGLGDYSADPVQGALPRVIDHTRRVLVSNGDYDLEIPTVGTLLSIQNMTWGGCLGFQDEPSTPIDIRLPDLQYRAVYEANGVPGWDGPGQGIMGIQHFERGLMWAETYQAGHMQPQFQPRSSYRHLQWVLGRIDEL